MFSSAPLNATTKPLGPGRRGGIEFMKIYQRMARRVSIMESMVEIILAEA